MLNYKEVKCSPSNMIDMSIRYDGDYYGNSRSAAMTCEKFLRSASLLPDGEFLGWQIDMKTFSSMAFSSFGVKVTMEDFDWIFHQCADVSPFTSGWMEDLSRENRKVYVLSSVEGSKRDIDVPEERKFYLSDHEILGMMTEMGVVIRIIAGSVDEKAKGHGVIFISLPDEITLRMRGMLSTAFPHMVAEEVGKLSEETGGLGCLPDTCFMEGMASILSVLMCRKDGKEPTDGAWPDDAIRTEGGSMDEDDHENDTDDDDEVYTDIAELELSVRSYNCLKRAGINTVEELRMLSDEVLMHVRNLGRRGTEEVKRKLAVIQEFEESIPLQETNYMARLDELIGLTEVKDQIKRTAALAKMKQDMAKDGNAGIPIALNMMFVGNPGTAKTTVARIAAGIFYEMGLLPCNELIEVGRANLVAKYIGHTAIKVKEVFAMAKGKVLFIDEAYSLVDGREGSFGDEAINTIIQEMENNREKTIVIFAGYPDKMESFFSRNPGLRSRVPFTVNFSDYSVEEMVKIAELEAEKRGFSIDTEAYGKVAALCSAAAHRPDMGNGRFCRNLIENAVLSYAVRVYGNDDGGDKNYILAAGDFTPPIGMNDAKKIPIGFHA